LDFAAERIEPLDVPGRSVRAGGIGQPVAAVGELIHVAEHLAADGVGLFGAVRVLPRHHGAADRHDREEDDHDRDDPAGERDLHSLILGKTPRSGARIYATTGGATCHSKWKSRKSRAAATLPSTWAAPSTPTRTRS